MATDIKIEHVKFNDEENAKAHHTDMFYANYENLEDCPVILRRAETFTWTVTFDQVFDPDNTKLWTLFKSTAVGAQTKLPIEIASPPDPSSKSKAGENGTQKEDDSKDNALIQRHSYGISPAQSRAATGCPTDIVARFGMKAKMLNVAISLPANAVPGEYTVQFGVAPENTAAVDVEMTTNVSRKVVLLCNPWDMCDDAKSRDVCSLSRLSLREDQRLEHHEAELKLYVTNTTANWWGNDVKHEWKLGQFDTSSLNFALTLLNKINLTGDEAKVLPNVIEAIANLLGKLVLKPSGSINVECLEIVQKQWSGSSEIIKKWQDKNEQLEDVQSWMFAGLLTTVLRTLGIGSRLVSGANTGIDLDSSGTIDIKYKRSGPNKKFERVTDDNKEGTSPIHVWTEILLNGRADLDADRTKYAGWQAIDASASAMIDAFTTGEHAVGPTPRNAIKNGDIIKDKATFPNATYWYSLLHADVLHEFVEVINGQENIVGHKFEENSLASNITTETYNINDKKVVKYLNYQQNYIAAGNNNRDDFYASLISPGTKQRLKDILQLRNSSTNTEIGLTCIPALSAKPIKLTNGAPVDLLLTFTNSTSQDQEYKIQYILINTTTDDVRSHFFDDKWKKMPLAGAPVTFKATTSAASYLHGLSNPWLIDAYVIATFKNQPELTTVYHQRFTVVPPELTVLLKSTTSTTSTPNTKSYTVSLTNNLPSSMCGCKMTLHVSPSEDVKISRSAAGFINNCDFIQPQGKMENEFTVVFPKLTDTIDYKISASIDCDQLGTIIAKTAVDATIDALAPSTPSSTMSTANSSENSSDAEDNSDDEDAREQKKKDDEAYKKRLQDVLAKMKCVQQDKDEVDDGVDQNADADVVEDISVSTKSAQITTKQQNDISNPQRFYCADTNIGTICVPASDVVATSPPLPGHADGNTNVDVVTTQGFNQSHSTVPLNGSGSGVPFKNTSQTKQSGGDLYQLGTDVDQRGNITTTRPTEVLHRAGQHKTGGNGNGSQRHGSSSRRDTTVKRCWLTGFPKRTRSHHI